MRGGASAEDSNQNPNKSFGQNTAGNDKKKKEDGTRNPNPNPNPNPNGSPPLPSSLRFCVRRM